MLCTILCTCCISRGAERTVTIVTRLHICITSFLLVSLEDITSAPPSFCLVQARCNSPHLVLLVTMLVFVSSRSSPTVSSRLLCAPIISVLVLVFCAIANPSPFPAWMFRRLPLSFTHLTLPSWLISLSYVCPSLCVHVLPSFVSDSFSREIRDAYLVLLFPSS